MYGKGGEDINKAKQLHHAEIDRIWAEWQAANPGQHPNLPGAAAIMDPWPENETATRDITALGYTYL